MDALYYSKEVIPAPKVPDSWSYTSLSNFNKCPVEWHLSRAKYNPYPRYPEKISKAKIKGEVIHLLQEDFVNYLQEISGGKEEIDLTEAIKEFGARKRLLKMLGNDIPRKYITNPRSKIFQIKGQINVDDCLNEFKSMIQDLKLKNLFKHRIKKEITNQGNAHFPAREGAEIFFRVDDPPVNGRIDAILSGKLIDYKSGEKHEEHKRQVEFYSLLYWYKFGESLDSIEIRYSKSGDYEKINPPDDVELEEMDKELRKKISRYQNSILGNNLNPRPSKDNCHFCDVRQLCDEYWTNSETEILRINKGMVSAEGDEKVKEKYFLDYELKEFVSNWVPGKSMVGKIDDEILGEIEIRIGREHCPDVGVRNLGKARLLGAVVKFQKGSIYLKTNSMTEVFWS